MKADAKHTIIVPYRDYHSSWVENVQWVKGRIFYDHLELPRSFQFCVVHSFNFNWVSRNIAGLSQYGVML